MGTFPLFWWVPFGRVPEVDAGQLKEKLEAKAPIQILDVRTRWEYDRGHIEGAVHVPIFELRSRLNSLPFDPRKPVVAICLTAHRSIPAVRMLKSYGFKDVCQLAGGMVAWRRKRLSTRSV